MHDRAETHAHHTPESGGLRLVIDQHSMDGDVHRRIDLSYVVEGKPYRALLDGPDVPKDVHSKVKALLKALLVTDQKCCRQMGFDDDDVVPPEPESSGQ